MALRSISGGCQAGRAATARRRADAGGNLWHAHAISPADPAPAPQAEPLSHSAEPGPPAPALAPILAPTTSPTTAPDMPPVAPPDAPPDAPPVLQDSRSLSLAVLAVLGAIFMLHWASAVVVPLVLALTLSYALAIE